MKRILKLVGVVALVAVGFSIVAEAAQARPHLFGGGHRPHILHRR